MNGENRHQRKLRKNLLEFIKDSSMATSWINDFFDSDGSTDKFALIFTRKGKKKSKPFDPTTFIENIKKDITDEVEGAFCDPDNDFDFMEWCDKYMANDDYANSKLLDELDEAGDHPMERLADPDDDDDEVGVFSISYVKYLEKQNDLLRKNSNKKEGEDEKRK